MKVNDMDIDDFMVSPTKDIDAFEEDEESEDFDAGADGVKVFQDRVGARWKLKMNGTSHEANTCHFARTGLSGKGDRVSGIE